MREKIGHSAKKRFSTKIFNLLMDSRNNKIWSAIDAEKLQSLIDRYTKIDPAFVQSKVNFYENKTKQTLTAAISAAKDG